MKSTPKELAEAFDLLHEFTNGTVHLEKNGDLQYGEIWIATVFVGYGRHKKQSEASSPAGAILGVVSQIDGNPINNKPARTNE